MNEENKLSIYNVYGFVVSVDGPADNVFSKEFRYFKTSDSSTKVNLFVKVNTMEQSLRKAITGFLEGIYIPFGEKEDTMWYNEGIAYTYRANLIIYASEFLMWWPNKAWLHAGAVAKNGNAYIFCGKGGCGKTSVVLNLIREGYDYLSDDWLIVGEGKAFPYPKRVHILIITLRIKRSRRKF